MDKQTIIKELVYRELEKRYNLQQNNLLEFMKCYFREERKEDLVLNWHIEEICKKLEAVERWEITRLIINIPPRSLKTETVAKCFPVWCLGRNPKKKFIAISYSADLVEFNSWWAREYYNSDTFWKIFPRRSQLKEDVNTKKRWENVDWWQYYAAWSTWTITWIWADIIIIDDPIKPDDADSEIMRANVINNYHNTIKHRLNDKKTWAIIIIMQRLHDDDLCWHLLEEELQGTWEKWDKLIIPAIDEQEKSFFDERFPIEFLKQMQIQNSVTFSCQYQQDPVAKESQEFHEEWFRYYDELPAWWRVFTVCDPAFRKGQDNDFSAIITGKFIDDKLYIMEITHWKFDPWQLIDKLAYHQSKWQPESIWIEAYAAQTIIWFNLRRDLQAKGRYVTIHDIIQKGDKETKIRKLIPLYRNWLIYHRRDMIDLETELKKFPRWKHDDMIDALQMLYNLYEIQPNTNAFNRNIEIKYDTNWRPIYIW